MQTGRIQGRTIASKIWTRSANVESMCIYVFPQTRPQLERTYPLAYLDPKEDVKCIGIIG